MQPHHLTRRGTLAGMSAAGLTLCAGCLGGGDDDEDEPEYVPEVPMVEDPPERVYLPTHYESMRMLEPVEAGEYRIGPAISYPHQFWLVDGTDTEAVVPEDAKGVHLMFTVWDPETQLVLPVESGAEVVIERDGESVGTPLTPWPMVTQEMGFHFGDNVTLPEDGTYEVTVDLPPLAAEGTGEIADRFEAGGSASFEFTYDEDFRHEVIGGLTYYDEEYWGEPGAMVPMDEHDGGHDHGDHVEIPYSRAPDPADLPGDPLEPTAEEATTGDAVFVATLLEADTRFDDERYLLVSPRTPYNEVPLSDMSLAVEVGVDRLGLTERIDHAAGLHYGTGVVALEPGSTIEVVIETPPQVARHQGYETAFLDMGSVGFELPAELP